MASENAVNLTISSSLPYDVNAMINSSITNSDKSSTLSPNILSLKANSDVNYKTFSSEQQNILLSSQASGTNTQIGLDFRLNSGILSKADVYKGVIKLEVSQK